MFVKLDRNNDISDIANLASKEAYNNAIAFQIIHLLIVVTLRTYSIVLHETEPPLL